MLELRKLLDDIEKMSQEMATRQNSYGDLAKQARQALARHAVVGDELLDKLERALTIDPTWRGAQPASARLDARQRPSFPGPDATLIGVDGSQIYPDRHGMALYYLINTGAIVLRQGSGEAPLVRTRPEVFYQDEDLYDDGKELIDARVVNAARELAEMRELAKTATEERLHYGGDLDRLVLALTDGPLLIWTGETDIDSRQTRQRIDAYLAQVQAIQNSGAIPVGYVDRPRSANVLRMLHVADLELTNLNKDTVRSTRYRSLTDRVLFADLAPNERSALFIFTTKVNHLFADAGQEVHFFYLNVAQKPDIESARIVRVDVPGWAANQPELLDRVQQAIYRDCLGTGYPYVLARAHELAVVTHRERADFEQMLAVAMLRNGVETELSPKASLKQLL